MLHAYRLLASRVGTPDAAELAHDLAAWHDAMVRHERELAAAKGPACTGGEDCPHVDARELWRQAQRVFGAEADALDFLRASAGATLADRVP